MFMYIAEINNLGVAVRGPWIFALTCNQSPTENFNSVWIGLYGIGNCSIRRDILVSVDN